MKRRYIIALLALTVCLVLSFAGCNDGNEGQSTVQVTKITLDKSAIALIIGEKQKLTPTIAPSNASDLTVLWSSSDEKVATVSNDGEITAVAKGTTTITAKTKSGNKSATCSVVVSYPEIKWDGEIVSTKPQYTVKPDRITLEDGTKIDSELVMINSIEEFIWLFQSGSINQITSANAVTVRLMNDFNLDSKPWTAKNIFGNSSGKRYILDGNNKYVSNVSATGSACAFLDASSTDTIQIVDLTIKGSKFEGTGDYAGVFNCNSTGKVDYIGCKSVSNQVSSKKYAGGISAVSSGKFENCYVDSVKIALTPSATVIYGGGLSGMATTGNVKNCKITACNLNAAKNDLSFCNQKIAAVFGEAGSKVLFEGSNTVKNTKIFDENAVIRLQLIHTDNRENNSFENLTVLK